MMKGLIKKAAALFTSALFLSVSTGCKTEEDPILRPQLSSVTVFHGGEAVSGDVYLQPGVVETFTAAAASASDAPGDITFAWSVANNGIVQLSGTGSAVNVRALNKGAARITVKASNGHSEAECSFTVVVRGAESMDDVLFQWDNAADPVTGSLTQGDNGTAVSAPHSGFPGIYFRARGSVGTAGGAFRLGGGASGGSGRLIVGGGDSTSGLHPSSGATGSAAHLPGQFDLSDGTFRLTVDYRDTVQGGSGSYLLRLLINNNTEAMADSVLGGASNIRTYGTVQNLRDGLQSDQNYGIIPDRTGAGTVAITFKPSRMYASNDGRESLKNAFITLHSQSSSAGNWITVTGIKLEKLSPRSAVFYGEFGARGDGVTDDFSAIAAAHDEANLIGAKVFADAGANYYIGGAQKTARIETDTDWSGAEFTIDDTKIARNPNSQIGWLDSWIFDVVSEQQPVQINSVAKLDKGQTKLNLPFPFRAVIVAFNNKVKHFIRAGVHEDPGEDQTDVFIVDRNGNVDPSAPIIWNFTDVTLMTAYPIDENVLTLTGGKFTTINNTGRASLAYVKRGIRVLRSNAVIDGVVHLVTGEGNQSAAYDGFLKFENCMNVTVKNAELTGHRSYPENDANPGVHRGTYDIHAYSMINLQVIDCRQTNSITDESLWGIHTSNYSKNITFDRVKFSRLDAHHGLHNAVILNSELGWQGVSIIGSGEMRIENTKVSGMNFISLRSDYGSTWNGDVIIRGCTFVPKFVSANYPPHVVYHINDGTWNFGYPCFMPETITIEGFTVEDGAGRNPPSWYSGVRLISTASYNAGAVYAPALTKTIYLSGYQSNKPYLISGVIPVVEN